MKGLMLREVKLARKNMIYVFSILAVMLLVHIMFLLSYRFGNLSHDLTEEQLSFKNSIDALYYFELMLLLLGSASYIGTIFNDVKSKWMTYSVTLPGGILRGVKVKYVCVLVSNMIAACVGTISTLIISNVKGEPLSAEKWTWFALVAAIWLVLESITLVLAYATGSQDRTALIWFLGGAAIYTGIALFAETLDKKPELMLKLMKLRMLIKDYIVLLCLAAVMLYALSYLASAGIMGRKEK